MSNRSIGFEAQHVLSPRRKGIARYEVELARAIAQRAPETNFHVYYPLRRILRRNYRIEDVAHRWYTRSPHRRAPTLMHAGGTRFPRWKSPIEIATVHDFFFHRMQASTAQSEAERDEKIAYLKRTDWAICVSDTTARDLIEIANFPVERIRTIPLGVNQSYRPSTDEEKIAFRRSHRLPSAFLLFVGQLRPNKNYLRAIEALALSRVDLPLVFAGRNKPSTVKRLLERAEACGVTPQIRFLPYVDEDQLPLLYGSATALFFPTLFEGFGLPVLEAMACETPVLTSRGTATEEVANSFATLVDPNDIESIADGLRRVVSSDATLLESAGKYARSMTWDETARKTLAVYEEAFQEAGR